MIRIKICGVTTIEDARYAVEQGADAIGYNFYEQSPRYLQPTAAMQIMRAMPAFYSAVGVFVNKPIRQATAMAFQLGLRAVQTVDLQPQQDDTFPFAHIPAFRVRNAEEILQAKEWSLKHRPNAILIDSNVPGQMGGTGHTAPWDLLAGVDFGVPLILAGGLTPENVAEAIAKVKPWGVDVASGVETAPGVKDHARIKAFISNAKAVITSHA